MKIASPIKLKFHIQNVDSKLCTGKPVPTPRAIFGIKKMGVTQVIDLREDAAYSRFFERLLCNIAGIKYNNIKVQTHTYDIPSIDFFDNINKRIVSNLGKTYLHCKYGRHRTGMCVAAYEKGVLKKDDFNIYISLIDKFSELLKQPKNLEIQNRLRIVFHKFVNQYQLNGQNPSVMFRAAE